MEIKDIDSKKPVRIILSGGGTAGHIYPAVAIAEKLQSYYGNDVDILFIGAKGKMEMEKVSELGYDIIGLPIAGFIRKFKFKNFLLPFKVLASIYLSKRIMRKFKPQIVLGFGGYASAPILKAAQGYKIATMIWEGNAFAGLTNKILSKHVQRVFVAHDGMDKFFEKDKIVLSGNPLRGNLHHITRKMPEAYEYFGFDNSKPILLVTGGSLGTKVFNEGVMRYFDKITADNIYNIIWQTGKTSYNEIMLRIGDREHKNIWVAPFIGRMDHAYGIADLTVARAGASTISELASVGMASIIIPSPYVANDHQRMNTMSLVDKKATVFIEDSDAIENMIPKVEQLIFNTQELSILRQNINHFAESKSADIILDEMKRFIIL